MPDYTVPGILVQEIEGPIIGALTTSSRTIALLGETQGGVSGVERARASATVTLSTANIVKESIKVFKEATGEVYTLTTDYAIEQTGKETKIKPVAAKIPNDTDLKVTFLSVPDNYYDATIFTATEDLAERFGPAFKATGEVNSPLTLAGQLAFVNGASSILAVAVKKTGDAVKPSDFEEALAKVSGERVSIIVPVTDASSIKAQVSAHVTRNSANGAERRAILGLDGTVSSVTSEARKTAAESIRNARVLLVSPSAISLYVSTANNTVTVGGQYVAAALAGLASSLGPAIPLTRKSIVGFQSIPRQEAPAVRDLETQSGVTTLEQAANGSIRVRHGVTTDPSSLTTREWSIVGQRDAMVSAVRDTLDNDGIIGSLIDSLTLSNVKASVDTALQGLVNAGTILSYTDLKVRQSPSQPDHVEVRFAWRASVPMNYVVVRYALNITSGSLETTEN